MSISKRAQTGIWIGVGFLTALLVSAGIAAAASHDGGPPSRPIPAVGPPVNYGGELSKQGEGLPWTEAISQVLSQPGMDSVKVVQVVPAPNWTNTDTPWLVLDESGQSVSGADEIRLTWLGALAQGAIAELHHTTEVSTNEVVGGATINVNLPDRTVPLDGGRGYVSTGQTFAAQGLSDDEIVRSVQQVLESYGLKALDIKVLHPLAPAILVRASIDDTVEPKWTVDELRDAIAGTPKTFEGVYLEIDDPKGNPLLASGTSYRTGLGGYWFSPGQDQRFGALHGGVPSTEGTATP